MERIVCAERPDWKQAAEDAGFDFHTIDGERYWDERAYYAFTLDEIEQQIELPTAELDAMCLALVERAVDDDEILARLKIPDAFWPLIALSWERDDASLYGRFDLGYDGHNPAKLLEYNADTPTSIFEAAVFQWSWLEDAIDRKMIATDADQFNSIHEQLIDAWREIGDGRHVHFAGFTETAEDFGTLRYLADVAGQAGLATTLLHLDQIGSRDDGGFVDDEGRAIDLAFKLYPWEWMFRDAFGTLVTTSTTRWIEPPWKAILSNKGMLPLLWEMFPNHPNLLPAYLDDEIGAAKLGQSFIRKPLLSREGANVSVIEAGAVIDSGDGPYGEEGYIRQAIAPLFQDAGQHAVIGSWIVHGQACGLSVREDESLITGNLSRFVPHLIR